MRLFSARTRLKDLRVYPLGATKVMTPRRPSVRAGKPFAPLPTKGPP